MNGPPATYFKQEVVTDTSAHTGSYRGILALTNCAVSAMTVRHSDDFLDSGRYTDLTNIPAGTFLPVRFTSITLTNGECILYEDTNS